MLLAAWGPGLVVMLADTDAGSVVTAAQSGAQWGYRLLGLQLALIPILFVVQELTVRLGIVTQKGHGELIRETFGKGWAALSVATLGLACAGAVVTELSGMAGVGSLFGVPVAITMTLTVGLLTAMVWTGSYRSIEKSAILLGAFEIAFLGVVWKADPHAGAVLAGLSRIPWRQKGYLYLAAANIGAVIMPWMVFYQQSAVVDKRLGEEHLRAARWDTAFGAIATQVVMGAVLMAAAATVGKTNPHLPLDTVQEISSALTPLLGASAGRLLFALGMSGAALVAAVVISLAAAWGVGEVLGVERSLDHSPKQAPWFYGAYTLTLVLGAGLVMSGINLVALSVAVEVMNALLLPIVLGFLFMLAIRALPPGHRLEGPYARVVGAVVVVTSAFGVYAALSGIAGGLPH